MLIAIAYFQPVSRAELRTILCRDVSPHPHAGGRPDGVRTAQPTAWCVLHLFHNAGISRLLEFDGLHELPDLEQLQDAGLQSKADALGTPQLQDET